MSTKLCSKELYRNFLEITAGRYSAVALSDVSTAGLSHDTVSRWLSEARCTPKEIWKANKDNILGKRVVIIAQFWISR